MRQFSLSALLSVLALVLVGCPAGNEGEQVVEPTSETPVASPVEPETEPTEAPFGTQATPPRQTLPSLPLVTPLSPRDRIAQVQTGRSDPFAALPVERGELNITIPQAETPAGAGGANGAATTPTPGGNGQATAPRGANGGNGNRAQQQEEETTIAAVPELPPIPEIPETPVPAIPESPQAGTPANGGNGGGTVQPFGPGIFTPVPEPTRARAVIVSGVVDVGGRSNAIVEVPNEPSRYVQVGERISNGQVLVKRIEMNRGPTPVVILEENGVEVPKRVGEQPA